MSRPWYEHLEASVGTGGVPFERCHGKELFRFMNDDPASDALFADALDSVEGLAGAGYARDLDWSRFDRVFDLGGSRGAKMVTLLERHAHLKAVVVDRSIAIQGAESYWRSRGKAHLLSRVQFESADILVSPPAASSDRDAYFLSAVLHGMDDVASLQLLRNLAEACRSTDAKIILFEAILPDAGASLPSALADIQLMMGTRGRVRTMYEWKALIQRAGLALEEIVHARPAFTMLVLQPRRNAVDG